MIEKLYKLTLERQWYKYKENEVLEKKANTPGIIDSLSVFTEDGRLTPSIHNFLLYKNDNEALFYKDMWKEICPSTHMNPCIDNEYSRYFVDEFIEEVEGENGKKLYNLQKLSHIQKFEDWLSVDNGNLKIKKFKGEVIFHIGTKGSGKTLWQNIWLHKNNSTLEEHKIFWIRLDVEKLYTLWERNIDITTNEYILGQMLYVFCKHHKDIKGNKVSKLFDEIHNKFKNDFRNIIEEITYTKKEIKYLEDPINELYKYAKTVEAKTVSDLLSYFEKVVAKYEQTYKGENERLPVSPHHSRNKSYLIDHVFNDKGSSLFHVWMVVAEAIHSFILENDYYILKIIDGVDNIVQKEHKINLEKKSFKQLCEFHLKKTDSNEIYIISLRDYMLERLKEFCIIEKYAYFKDGRYLDFAYYQDKRDIGKDILSRRIDYILNKYNSNCKMKDILKKINVHHRAKVYDCRWNYNYRCFITNHFSLTKYITARYYLRKDDTKFDTIEEIDRFEDVNFLLNGELFLSKDHKESEDYGQHGFNIFDFNLKSNKPYVFLYPRVLLLIKNHKKINSDTVRRVMNLFDVGDDICSICLNRLVDYGLIRQSVIDNSETPISEYIISDKGELILDKYFNDIHYLYYLSLDTYLPKVILNNIEVAPNNLKKNEKRRYPITCIKTGLTFLNYLHFKNENDLNKIKSKEFKILGIDKSIFKIPIKEDILKQSLKSMIDIIEREPLYKEALTQWFIFLQKTKVYKNGFL